jgi:hypothetical protein
MKISIFEVRELFLSRKIVKTRKGRILYLEEILLFNNGKY